MERMLIKGVLCYVSFEGKQIMIYRAHSSKDIHYQKMVASGGGLEEGETLEQSAEREAWEELGVRLENLKKRGRVFFNNVDRTFNGQRKDWDYECEVYTALTHDKPKEETDLGDKIYLFDPRDILLLPQHDCDRQIWALLQSCRQEQFNIEFRYSGENMSLFEVRFC
jgi:8-oxo-dGTP pyrophosphatase MutT (NUDIX family)